MKIVGHSSVETFLRYRTSRQRSSMPRRDVWMRHYTIINTRLTGGSQLLEFHANRKIGAEAGIVSGESPRMLMSRRFPASPLRFTMRLA